MSRCWPERRERLLGFEVDAPEAGSRHDIYTCT